MMNQARLIFDRKRQRLLRSRAAPREGSQNPYFLHNEIESILLERLACIRCNFPRVLLTTPVSRRFVRALLSQGHGDKYLIECNSVSLDTASSRQKGGSVYRVAGDEEALPFVRKTFDLIVSFLNLHQLNDVPEVLMNSKELLKPEGLYLAAFFGGDTLCELREAFLRSELEMSGGAFPRVHPMITPEEATRLFDRAGFKLPVIDHQKFTLLYPSLMSLLKEIKRVGEGNSLIERSTKPLSRSLLRRVEDIFHDMVAFRATEGYLRSTVDVVFLTGWA
ncbi:MAG: methyltransferase domain-containing protein [Caedimonas sp.]|nr:methyltransferase domain-containing protein [Caedimonas sp.]